MAYNRGFTVIELLVVISIIALLAGMLTVSIGTVRQRARDTVCMSNLRQISVGVLAFANDHQGRAPGSGFLTPFGTSWGAPPQWPRWIGTQSVPINPSAGVVFSEFYAGQGSSTSEPATCQLILHEYLDAKRMFLCPAAADVRSTISSPANLNQFFPYGMNLILSGNRYGEDLCGEESPNGDPALPSWRKCPRLLNVPGRSSATVFMMDMCTEFDFAYREPTSVDDNVHPACLFTAKALHNRGKQVTATYCDGHVESVPVVLTTISGFARLCVPTD
jgi:prepilin-type N-terminal cleavage/methylation domain-containing protein/prepilin-type processing-associated H-X9-DG protein